MGCAMDDVPYLAIRRIMRRYRNQLENLWRWNGFRGRETDDEWLLLLGPDVSSLTHPRVTVNIVKKFIGFNDGSKLGLRRGDWLLLLAAAWVHDWGELNVGE